MSDIRSMVISYNVDNSNLETVPEASATTFSDPIFFDITRPQEDGSGTASPQSVVRITEPNALTEQVFAETDAGADIVLFNSIEDLFDDLDA